MRSMTPEEALKIIAAHRASYTVPRAGDVIGVSGSFLALSGWRFLVLIVVVRRGYVNPVSRLEPCPASGGIPVYVGDDVVVVGGKAKVP
jgi:hypothetical protein